MRFRSPSLLPLWHLFFPFVLLNEAHLSSCLVIHRSFFDHTFIEETDFNSTVPHYQNYACFEKSPHNAFTHRSLYISWGTLIGVRKIQYACNISSPANGSNCFLTKCYGFDLSLRTGISPSVLIGSHFVFKPHELISLSHREVTNVMKLGKLGKILKDELNSLSCVEALG